jgi:hypothetical protein
MTTAFQRNTAQHGDALALLRSLSDSCTRHWRSSIHSTAIVFAALGTTSTFICLVVTRRRSAPK